MGTLWCVCVCARERKNVYVDHRPIKTLDPGMRCSSTGRHHLAYRSLLFSSVLCLVCRISTNLNNDKIRRGPGKCIVDCAIAATYTYTYTLPLEFAHPVPDDKYIHSKIVYTKFRIFQVFFPIVSQSFENQVLFICCFVFSRSFL